MKEVITDVHSLSSGTGWLINNASPESSPVAAFALVSVINSEHLMLGSNKIVIALSGDEIAIDLKGTEVTAEMRSVISEKEVKTWNED